MMNDSELIDRNYFLNKVKEYGWIYDFCNQNAINTFYGFLNMSREKIEKLEKFVGESDFREFLKDTGLNCVFGKIIESGQYGKCDISEYSGLSDNVIKYLKNNNINTLSDLFMCSPARFVKMKLELGYDFKEIITIARNYGFDPQKEDFSNKVLKGLKPSEFGVSDLTLRYLVDDANYETLGDLVGDIYFHLGLKLDGVSGKQKITKEIANVLSNLGFELCPSKKGFYAKQTVGDSYSYLTDKDLEIEDNSGIQIIKENSKVDNKKTDNDIFKDLPEDYKEYVMLGMKEKFKKDSTRTVTAKKSENEVLKHIMSKKTPKNVIVDKITSKPHISLDRKKYKSLFSEEVLSIFDAIENSVDLDIVYGLDEIFISMYESQIKQCISNNSNVTNKYKTETLKYIDSILAQNPTL